MRPRALGSARFTQTGSKQGSSRNSYPASFRFRYKRLMFLSLDYLYVPANDIEESVRYYTAQLGGELVWKIHAFNAWVAAVRLSPARPMVLLADHLRGETPILIYRVQRLESTIAELRARGWQAESGPFEIPKRTLLHLSRSNGGAAGRL